MKVSPYSITFLLSFLIAFGVVYILLRKMGMDKQKIVLSIVLNVTATFIGSKLYMVFVTGFQKNIFNSGISSLGGVIGLLLGIWIMATLLPEDKEKLWKAHLIVVPLMYSISKIGCHLMGCCHGISYNGFGAMTYDTVLTKGGPYFPVQITETIMFFLIFLICLVYVMKKGKYQMSLVFFLCGLGKFACDFLREEHIGKILSINQIICIIFMVLGIVLLLKRKKV